MSEVKRVKLTPDEIRTAKNAAAAEKALAIANKLMLAANLAAAEAKQEAGSKTDCRIAKRRCRLQSGCSL
jgi:catalase (peroxidase I)